MNILATSLLLACAGVALVWPLRRPARHLAGAGPAFGLWLLVPLLAAVAWLPAAPQTTPSVFTLPTLIPVMVVPTTTAPAASSFAVVPIAFFVWLTGSVLMLARLVWHSWRITRSAQPLPAAMRQTLSTLLPGRDLDHARRHPAGPAVCWLPHCRLLLPADLLDRFSHDELLHVLAHERMHLTRRDPLWSLAAEIMLAALWFFPPAWLAMSRFRLDQELACDAAIMRATPTQAGAYARALLTSVTAPRVPTVTTPWLSPSQLKERLLMIQAHSHSLLARRSGYASLAVLLAGTALAAHAALPNTRMPSAGQQLGQPIVDPTLPSSPITYRHREPPVYPVDARKNHQQGTVTLLVKVGTKGHPLTAEIAQSSGVPSLDKAAYEAAMQWLFNPETQNGRPVVGWTRIKINFSLDHDTASARSAPQPIVNPYLSAGQLPMYPATARKQHQSGTVMLLIKISADGKPVEVKPQPTSPSPPKAMVSSATKAAWTWRFKPRADSHGKPYSYWARVPVQFQARAAHDNTTAKGQR